MQLSLPGSSSARPTASSSLRPYFATMARASASVVGSGTVGPDAIADGSSCGTSEIASVTISARWPARASRPPLIRDRCLRTVLISPIGAPERSSARVTCCFCANDTPSAGAIQLAEPPPDSSTSSRSSASALCGQPQAVLRALQPGLVGHRMAGLDHLDPPRRHAVAVTGGGDARTAATASGRARRDNAAPPPRPSRLRPCRRRGRSRGLSAAARRCGASTRRDARRRRRHRRSRAAEGVCRSSLHGCDRWEHGTPVIRPIARKRKPPQQAAGV